MTHILGTQAQQHQADMQQAAAAQQQKLSATLVSSKPEHYMGARRVRWIEAEEKILSTRLDLSAQTHYTGAAKLSHIMEKLLLTEKDVAYILNLSLPTLRRWRASGGGPQHIKIGASVRYRETDVRAWIESRSTVNSQKEVA